MGLRLNFSDEVAKREVGLLLNSYGSSLSFRMKVAMKPLLLTLFDSKGEQPPQLVVWGGVLVISCLGYEEFLQKRQSPVFDEDLSINR